MTEAELYVLGVVWGRLDFNAKKFSELAERLPPKAKVEVWQLHSRILDIYDHVNMDVRLLFPHPARDVFLMSSDSMQRPRTITDAVLLSLAKNKRTAGCRDLS